MKHPYYENNNCKIFLSKENSSYSFPLHFHSFIEIVYCFSGEQIVKVDDVLYQISKGDVLIVFPYIPHEYLSNDENSNTRTISVMCSLTEVLNSFPEFLQKQPICPHIKAEKISPNTTLAFSKIEETENMAELLGWTYIILSDTIKYMELMPRKNTRTLDLPGLITTYIKSNFSEPLSLETLSKKFSYSSSYIAHIFCDELKVPFRTYLNSVRCEYAANQLRTTKKSVTTIAHESGYSSLNTFCRCFKQNFGATPSQYKKAQSKN